MSAGLWVRDSAGVSRNIKKLYTNVGGVTRELKELWVNDAGVARKIFSSGVKWYASAWTVGDIHECGVLSDGYSFYAQKTSKTGTGEFHIYYSFNAPLQLNSQKSIVIDTFDFEMGLYDTRVAVDDTWGFMFGYHGATVDAGESALNSILHIYRRDSNQDDNTWYTRASIYLNTVQYGQILLTGNSGLIKND